MAEKVKSDWGEMMGLSRRNGVVGGLVLLVSVLVLFGGMPQASAEIDIAETTKAAEQGNVEAQTLLGALYALGQGVSQDDRKALAWYRKAAEQGYATAQYNLAVMCANGKGVPKDDKQAFIWCRKAAEQGYPDAQVALGFMYANGQGVPKDDINAYAWSSLPATQGNKDAAQNRDIYAEKFTPQQLSKAKDLAAGLQAKIDRQKK